MHDAFFGLVARALIGVGDVKRQAQVHPAFARMASCAVGLAVGPDVRGKLEKRTAPHRRENRIAEFAHGWECVRAVDRDAQFRNWFLIGLGYEMDIVERIETSL